MELPRELHYRIIVDAATELPIGSPSFSSVDPARRHSGKEREEIGLSGRRPICLDMARNGSSIREPRSPESRRVAGTSSSNDPLIAREALDDGSLGRHPGTEGSPQPC